MAGIRGDQIALYVKDMYKAEREGYKEMETKYNLIFKVVNGVKGAGDKITQILGAGSLTRHKQEGQDIVYKSPVQGWEFFVKYWTYSDGIALSKEAVEDTVKLGNLLKDLSQTWGKQVRITKETHAARVFNFGGYLNGDWVFDGTCTGFTPPYAPLPYDDRPQFAIAGNNHALRIVPVATVTGTGTLYNSIASLPLSPANFETVYNLHTATNNRDERNLIIQNPADTLLVQPGQNRFLADRIMGTEKGLPGGQLNDINPYYKLCTVIDWDYLNDGSASTAAFYVGKRQSDDFQFHERQMSEIRFFRDETNLGYKTSINIRIGTLLKNFRTWSRGGGSSSNAAALT